MPPDITLRNLDCIDWMQSQPGNSVNTIITDPPYGIEFRDPADKSAVRDGLGWHSTGGFSTGGSDRFKNSVQLPSFGASSENRICRKCKGTERGKDRKGFIKCRCGVDSDFPDRKATSNTIGLAIAAWHLLWLSEADRILSPYGLIKIFSATRTQHRLVQSMISVGFTDIQQDAWCYLNGFPKSQSVDRMIDKQGLGSVSGATTVGASQNAALWESWGTAIKPSHEPVLVGRKPPDTFR